MLELQDTPEQRQCGLAASLTGMARYGFRGVTWLIRLQEADLKRLHEDGLKRDPFISRAVGPAAKVERMRVAALRLGSQGVPRSFDDHLLIIGDAAGHIDPLTGEGIHTAMMARPLGSACGMTTMLWRGHPHRHDGAPSSGCSR